MVTSARFSKDEHERIAQAIAAAERKTSGEIYCVLAHDSDGYFFPAAFLLSGSILVASLLVGFGLEWQWHGVSPAWFAAAQFSAFILALAAVALFPALRLLLVPRRLQERRAHQNAAKQFLARNIHRTTARTGVLIFVSVAERYAEIIADAGIDAKVEPDEWARIVDDLTRSARGGRLADGFVEAVAAVGQILEAHFPPGLRDGNELDDHLVEI